MARYAEGVGKKDRIKRLHDQAKRLDQIGEAYIDACGQLENGVRLVWLFGRSITSHAEATLALHDELQRQALDPADLLRVMKRKRDEANLGLA